MTALRISSHMLGKSPDSIRRAFEPQKPVDPENGTLLPSAPMNLPANVLQVVRVVVID
jgi:hypothetical protein